MAIEFNCPHCGKLLTTSELRAGARAKCPACGALTIVPTPSPAGTFVAGEAPPAAAWSAASRGSQASDRHLSDTAPWHEPSSQVSAPAAVFCPTCRRQVDARSVYCSTCGSPLVVPDQFFRYAGFWRRAAAMCVDLAVVGMAVWVAGFFVPHGGWVGQNLGLVLWLIYFSALESSRERATVGKRTMGIAVCGADGRRLTFPRAAIRTLAKILSLLICGVGFIMPLLTARKQALHDLLTDAVVVQR